MCVGGYITKTVVQCLVFAIGDFCVCAHVKICVVRAGVCMFMCVYVLCVFVCGRFDMNCRPAPCICPHRVLCVCVCVHVCIRIQTLSHAVSLSPSLIHKYTSTNTHKLTLYLSRSHFLALAHTYSQAHTGSHNIPSLGADLAIGSRTRTLTFSLTRSLCESHSPTLARSVTSA